MALPKWLQILEEVGPIVLTFTPLAPIAPIVVAGINIAEQIPGATGDQKKTFVQQLVGLGAQGANTVTGKSVIDPSAAATATRWPARRPGCRRT